MSEKRGGMAPLPTGLLRPTTQLETPEPIEAADDNATEGRGVTASAKTRRKRVVVSTATKGRKLHLPDEIHDRLWMLARQRKTTVSAVATDLLDKALPRWRVEREG